MCSQYHSTDSFGQLGDSLNISSKHFRIYLGFNGRVILTDSSLNHTYLNNEVLHKLQTRVLQDGDIVYMSKVDSKLADYTVRLYQDRIQKLLQGGVASPSSPTTLKRESTLLAMDDDEGTYSFSDALTQEKREEASEGSSNSAHSLKRQKREEDDVDAELEGLLTCGICQDILFRVSKFIELPFDLCPSQTVTKG